MAVRAPSAPAPRPPARERLATRPLAGTAAAVLVLLALLAAALWSFAELRINVATFVDGSHQAVAFVRRTLPLDFPPLLGTLRLCGQTLGIVILATPAPDDPVDAVILLIRSIPELILAIVFVVITGLGEVAGAVALAVGAVGLLGKLVADSLEEIDAGPERALQATGGSRWQVFFAASLPAGARALVAHVLHLLDTNIRAATLLGIVGAGGIGYYLLSASRVLEFGVVTTILIMIFAAVMLVELLAIWLRDRF
ncbi:PhnE/PtxC family ABC transporter permease [Pseudonocardia xinjiangensis]|uniref:PhnE/PtxC family ABC transporter permease n=1 Tax=Pseudonocardia xinjiangensis TaxID=75289 RepID=UPI003D910818